MWKGPGSSVPAETQRTLQETNRKWKWEFLARGIAALLSLVGACIFIACVAITNKDYGGDDWPDGLPLAALFLALIYDIFIITFTMFFRHGRPVSPIISIIVDFHIWALAIPGLVFSIGTGWFWWWQPAYLVINDNFVPCDYFNWWSKACNPAIYTIGRMELTANVFLAIVTIIHMGLFGRDCVMCHRLRKQRVMHMGSVRRNIELQYHRGLDEHERQMPPTYSQSEQTMSGFDSSQHAHSHPSSQHAKDDADVEAAKLENHSPVTPVSPLGSSAHDYKDV